MKRLFLIAWLILFSQAPLSAGALSSEELKRATDHLQKTSVEFLESTANLSDAQTNFKASPGRWSVAEVAEHIASAEDFLMGLIQGQVMKGEPRSDVVDLKEIDDLVLQAIADRTNKIQAPEPLAPTNRFGSMESSRDHFKESRAKTLAFLKLTPDLRDHAVDSPLGKKLDAYQWLLFISAHCERHTKQIKEVKADANFPTS